MAGIFISYRRKDSAGWAGPIAQSLRDSFGDDQVFIDIEAIDAGSDFTAIIESKLDSANVALVLIGPNWLTASDKGQRRLDDPKDLTRLEVATALNRDIPVVPVLLGGGSMPTAEELPEDIRNLTLRNAFDITDMRRTYDQERLIKLLEKPGYLNRKARPRHPDQWSVLKHLRRLPVWAAAGTLVLPFVASFMSVIPPWPRGLDIMTALFQTTTFILVYQKYATDQQQSGTRGAILFATVAFLLMIAYFYFFSVFTIYVPEANRSIVVGLECSHSASMVFGTKCPFLDLEDLAGVAYDEFLLWTKPSIALTRGVLIGLWLGVFLCLAAAAAKLLALGE
jgi:hypothetical protein